VSPSYTNVFGSREVTNRITSQAAIVQGAALRGLLGTAPSSKRLRKHYGHTLGKVFRPGIDKEEDSYINPFVIGEGNDGKMVNGYMTWIISKARLLSSLPYMLRNGLTA
jgi:hypothetical protein